MGSPGFRWLRRSYELLAVLMCFVVRRQTARHRLQEGQAGAV